MATANAEAAAVKAARATKPKAPVKADPTGNVTGRTQPAAVGLDEPPRNYFMLGDPDEPRAVIESAGALYGPILGADYVVAPEDATESFVPYHCRDSVTRQIWCTGQHVPIERFFAHYGEEKARELIAAAEAARQPAAAPEPEKTDGDGEETKQPENPPA
jgi:hypothetical protein